MAAHHARHDARDARTREIARDHASTCAPCRPTSTPTPTRCTPRCASTSRCKRMPDGSYFLTRYADLVAVYRDAQTFSSDKKAEFGPKYGAASPLFEHHTTSLVFNDPPLHTRVRQLIMGALTRRAIAAMEAGLVTLVDGLLDAHRGPGRRRPGGGLRRGDSGGDHRQPAGRAACRPRSAARLVAGDPGRAGAHAHARTGGARQPQRARVQRLPEGPGGRAPPAPRRPRARRADAADPGRGRTRASGGEPALRGRVAAELHLHPQRRPRDHHQPDRQRAGGAAGMA